MPYKRHELLVDCLKTIKDIAPDTFADIRIHLTIGKEDAPSLYHSIMDNGMKQQFVFHGKIPYEELCSYYQHSHALLFPSEMETVGLPLLEAASYGLPIAVTDMPYSHEGLSKYDGAKYMTYERDWADFIIGTCQEKKRYMPLMYEQRKDSWKRILSLVANLP